MKYWILGVLLALPALAQDKFTCHAPNGDAWRAMTERDRVYYLQGFLEAVNVEGYFKLPNESSGVLAFWPEGFNVPQVERLLDGFYEDPANAGIAIHDALFF